MLTWVLVNTVLSLLALGFAQLNQGAPHRLRFHVCFVALLCWLVPWAQVPGALTFDSLAGLDFSFQLQRAEQQLIASTANATQVPLIVIDTSSVPLADDLTLLHVPLLLLTALLLAGLGLFGWHVIQHHLRLRSLQRTARDGSLYWRHTGIDTTIPIRLQTGISGAFSSGILKPVIWVHDDLVTTPELPTLLRHELTHIQQHDNWYLVAITLVEKLLWWNPLAWYLGQQSRQLQELSCDERCRAGNADYAADLAQLMLSNAGISRSLAPEPLLLSANIFNNPNLNIQRLKVLQRSHQMKPRHIVSAIATAVFAITTVGLVTAQPQAEQDVLFIRKVEGTEAPVGAGTVMITREFNGESTLVPGENPQVLGLQTLGEPGDQFMKVERRNGNESISFSFTNAALPMVLSPLAESVGGPDPALATGPGAGEARHFLLIRKPEGEAGVQIRTDAPPPQGGNTPIFEQRIDAGAGAGDGDGAGAGPQTRLRLEGAGDGEFPVSSSLVIEDDGARTRQLTVSGENLTLEEAIDRIAEASKCNIFKDGKTIVVDYCEAQ